MTAMYLGLSLFPIIDVPRLLLCTAVGRVCTRMPELTAAPLFHAYSNARGITRACDLMPEVVRGD